VIIAVAHIVGSVFAVFIIALIGVSIASWETERNHKHFFEDISAKFGVAVDELESEEMIPRIIQFSSERNSSELLKNRLSDFCGVVLTVWGWLGGLIEAAFFIRIVWLTITKNLDEAVFAWYVVGIMLFFAFVSVAFSLICRLLTGRYPGQAKEARKAIAELLKTRRAAAV
jgi:apolipoprotein N-acyltransferase